MHQIKFVSITKDSLKSKPWNKGSSLNDLLMRNLSEIDLMSRVSAELLTTKKHIGANFKPSRFFFLSKTVRQFINM